jgi:NAD+ kinase
MRILLYGRYGEFPQELEKLVKSFNLEIYPTKPKGRSGVVDVVICYGGDGTLLGAERDYPGIPKLPLKNSGHCHLCSNIPNEKLLGLLVKNSLKFKEFNKIEALIGNKKIIALNDIIIAHKFPNSAIRFRVNDGPELIGDGVVISTVFGSTGYFNSITHHVITDGIGIAFNNIHPGPKSFEIVSEDAVIKIALTRGPAVLAADNDPNLIDFAENQEIFVKKSDQIATILTP